MQSTDQRREHNSGLHHDHIAQEALGGTSEDLGATYFKSPAFLGTLSASCLAQISSYLGWVLPSNTLALIDADIGPSPNTIWVAVAWTTGMAIGSTLVGRLSDIFGRRWFIMGCCMLAMIANIIGASAQSIDMLIATNALNGLASAGQLSFNTIMGELVTNKNRGPVNSLVLFTSLPFAVFGPPVARAFYENTDLRWRWCYILGIIVNALAIALYFFLYHPPTYEMLHVGGKSRLKQVKSLDWLGIALFTTGLTLFLIGLNWGGSSYSWSSGHVLGALLSGFATLALFCVWESYTTLDYPLMPMRLFRNIKSDAVIACASVGSMIYYSMTVIWPNMISSLFTTDVQEVGWLSCAVGGGMLLGQLAGGFGIRFIPRMKIQMLAASVIVVGFVAALASSNASTRGRTIAFLLIGSMAVGYVENLTLSAIALLWDPEDIGLIGGTLAVIRTSAGAIATSMYSSILASQSNKNIPNYVGPAAVNAGLPESSVADLLSRVSTGAFDGVPGITAGVTEAVGVALKRAYSESYMVVFLCTLPFGVILLISAVICPNVEDYLTSDVARKLHKPGQEKNEVVRKEIVDDEDV
ncbi:fungal trichothecene efflux pump [Aulographum hederae CBS 113979]|uniref:Fungal trichothecene efflux pump n=1 Tax=Aulographum hederae CBS 113979 TaxID=1176131 RepID=A0A6G1HEV0_9PEZI|nr:fungal trichothecene efflux pump [Aulographum hederae CBS 113979]